MARDFDFDFDDEELMKPRRSANRGGYEGRPAQSAAPVRQPRQPRQPQGDRMPGAPARTASRSKKSDTRSIIILAAEVVVFIILLVTFFILKGKIVNGDVSDKKKAESEYSESADGATNNGVNVDNESFKLECTKVQLATDAEGNPAALIYFNFTNKTSTPMAMSQVFGPHVKQNGAECAINASLAEEPIEVSNKDVQVADGQTIECCYVIGLQDLTSTLTLMMRDEYETFQDLGSTDIPLS